ncbi:hypothetical protein GCM10008938_11690 [Deinococcus roseus]|uniref:peptidoglycan glycosyltransferase n=2 Tax=Deinococcus roseus TaxID=392414 RepID=A0ABQ2CWB3_9DEIO|nr:hypothetical protein GCM10008938_11690 [Deinococcus roseus]
MRFLSWFFRFTLLLMLLGIVGLGITFYRWQPELKKVSTLQNLKYAGRATLLDSEGRVVKVVAVTAEGHVQPARKFLTPSQISPWLQKAVVASEDVRFFEHQGIDLKGLSRALWKTLSGDTEGGSTITQQVVKNTLLAELHGARTLERKLKEAFFALEVENEFSKEEILNLYLNLIYWGKARNDLIGVQDAARAYFNKNAVDLNLAESVYLALLLPTPARYLDYPAYRPLMKDLLSRMVEKGTLTQHEADQAWRYPLQPAGWTVKYDKKGKLLAAKLTDRQARKKNFPQPEHHYADAFLDEVERELVQHVRIRDFYTSDIRVYTTLNRKAQLAAETASQKAVLPAGATLGMALLDPLTGDVQALVGQKLNDGVFEEWNHATRSRRQVGSSIKPLLYTLALQKGWQQSDTVLDAPLQGKYQPQNYSGTSTGEPIMLRRALDHSLNLPTLHLLEKIGVEDFKKKLTLLGLQPDPQAGLAIGIGALEATPLDMAAAYAPFVNGGMYRAPRFITQITMNGAVLKKVRLSKPVRVWSEPVAYLGWDMIRGVVNDLTPQQGGLGWKARIPGWQVGGKTGTTNEVKDLWFVGTTPKLTGAVWVGKNDNTPMPKTAYSGTISAPIWQQAVSLALQNEKTIVVDRPRNLVTREVTGLEMAFYQPKGQLHALVAVKPVKPAAKPISTKTQQSTPQKVYRPIKTPAAVSATQLQMQRLAEARKRAAWARQQELQRQAAAQKQALLRQQALQQQAAARQKQRLVAQREQQRRTLRTETLQAQAAFLKRQQRKVQIAQALNARTSKQFAKQYNKIRKQNKH